MACQRSPLAQLGAEVTTVRPGHFVVGSFLASDGTCPNCLAGYQSACRQRQSLGTEGAQAQALRVPPANGTLVPLPDHPSADLLPSLLAASDVLGTGWFAAEAALVRQPSWSATAPSASSASSLRVNSALSASSR